jgi:hypothetical protein
MARFDLSAYATVEERLTEFWLAHPSGRVATAITHLDPPLVVVRAEVYRDASDLHPAATGMAYEMEGAGSVNSTSYIENCETSAIGRALANLGLHGKRDAPRPSREEMEKVERMRAHRDALIREAEGVIKALPTKERNSPLLATGVSALESAMRNGEVERIERGLAWLREVVP